MTDAFVYKTLMCLTHFSLTIISFFLSLQAGGSHSSSEQGYIVSINFTPILVYFVFQSVLFLSHLHDPGKMRRVYQLSHCVGTRCCSTFFFTLGLSRCSVFLSTLSYVCSLCFSNLFVVVSFFPWT